MPQLAKTLRFWSAAVPLVWMSGCGGSPHAPEERYFLVATNIKLPYWQNAAAGLNRAAAQLRVRAEMVGPDSYDPKAQHEEFQKVLRQRPTGILVSAADPGVIQPDIDAAIGQGIPVLTMDSDAAASKRLAFIGTDNYKAGTMGGEIAAKQLRGKGNVVIFTIHEQDNLQQRLHGYEAAFASHPQIRIAEVIDVRGDPRIAFDRTMELVEKDLAKADAFVCLEATACPEVAEVLDRKKVKGKLVVAMDTDQRTLEAIQQGIIAATIGQKPFTMAFYGLKMLDDLHHHKPESLDRPWRQESFSPLPAFVDTGAMLVDQSNVATFLKAAEPGPARK